MKKIFIVLITLLFVLTGCAKEDIEQNSTDIFSNTEAAEELDGRWLFLPEKAVVIRTTATNEKLQADFSGCEHAEINEYAKDIFDTLLSKGCKVYDAKNPFSNKPLTEFKEVKLDTSFAGTAYAYYYVMGDTVYFIKINYYGCGGGKYGNGKTSVVITDETEVLSFLLEE